MTTSLSLTHEYVTESAESLLADYGVNHTIAYARDADIYLSELGVESVRFPVPAQIVLVAEVNYHGERLILLTANVPAEPWSGHPSFIATFRLTPDARICFLIPIRK